MIFSIYSISYLTTSISEFCFISLSIIFLIEYKKNGFNMWLVVIGCLVFLFRYLGIFLLLYIFLEFLIGRRKDDLKLLLCIGFFIFFYLIFIKLNTGFISGANRVGTSDSRFSTLFEIIKSFFTLFSFFEHKNIDGKFSGFLYYIGFLFIVPIFVCFFQYIKKVRHLSHWILFGFAYLILYVLIVIIPDWRHVNESIPNRFLLPGFLFILIGVLKSVSINRITYGFICIGILLSFSFNGVVKPLMDLKKYNGLTYFVNISNIKDEKNPAINPEKHLKYLMLCEF